MPPPRNAWGHACCRIREREQLRSGIRHPAAVKPIRAARRKFSPPEIHHCRFSFGATWCRPRTHLLQRCWTRQILFPGRLRGITRDFGGLKRQNPLSYLFRFRTRVRFSRCRMAHNRQTSQWRRHARGIRRRRLRAETLESRLVLASTYFITELRSLADSDSAAAVDINHLGEIVGNSTRTGLIPISRAVKWDPGGLIQDLGTLGGDEAWARAINDSGQVTGVALDAGGKQDGFRFDPRRRDD